MRALAFLLRRAVTAILAAYAVITVVFLFVAVTPDPHLSQLLHHATRHSGENASVVAQEVRRTYAETRGLNRPLYVRYADWLYRITTLQWGQSYSQGAPVLSVLGAASERTLTYVLPAVVVSSVGSTLVALLGGSSRGGVFDRLASGASYVGFGLPNFVLGTIVVIVFLSGTGSGGASGGRTELATYGLAAAVLSTTLVAGQLHYARAEIGETLNEKFVTVLKAKGVGGVRLARHVLRSATVPLLSVFLSDLLAILLLHVFVIEAVFGIPGIGDLTITAVRQRDMPLILGTTMVVVLVGIFGHLLEDVAAYVLDPRVRSGETGDG